MVRGGEEADARIGEEWGNRAGHVVGCAVVDDDAFPVDKRLRQERAQRLAQEVGYAIGRDNHCHARGCVRVVCRFVSD